MDSNFEIFDGKSFKDLCKDIVLNSEHKKCQIDLLINELKPMAKSINDALLIVPLIKQYLEVGVENDTALVKLAAVIQRILCAKADTNSSDGFVLSDEERQQLIKEIEDVKKDNDETVINIPVKNINK